MAQYQWKEGSQYGTCDMWLIGDICTLPFIFRDPIDCALSVGQVRTRDGQVGQQGGSGTSRESAVHPHCLVTHSLESAPSDAPAHPPPHQPTSRSGGQATPGGAEATY